MNAGERTAAIAQGITFWARVQRMPGNQIDGSDEIQDWNAWVDIYGADMEQFVKDEQYALFDRVNAKSWRY